MPYLERECRDFVSTTTRRYPSFLISENLQLQQYSNKKILPLSFIGTAPLQFFLTCSERVTISRQTVGYRFDGQPSIPSPILEETTLVLSWDESMEDELQSVQVDFFFFFGKQNPFNKRTSGTYFILSKPSIECQFDLHSS